MSAYYDLYETPSPDGKEDKKSLHARICPKRTYTQKEFVEHIATFQHLPKNVIGAALDACIDELCDLLANGNIVELGELGFFSTSLKCLRETDDEKKENPLRIRPIPKRTPAHQQHVPQQHQEENDVGTCTLHYQEIEKK